MPRLPKEEFAAFVDIDWADAKHDVCLQAVGDHKPKAIDAWAWTIRKRFEGRPVALGLELHKGPRVYALQRPAV